MMGQRLSGANGPRQPQMSRLDSSAVALSWRTASAAHSSRRTSYCPRASPIEQSPYVLSHPSGRRFGGSGPIGDPRETLEGASTGGRHSRRARTVYIGGRAPYLAGFRRGTPAEAARRGKQSQSLCRGFQPSGAGELAARAPAGKETKPFRTASGRLGSTAAITATTTATHLRQRSAAQPFEPTPPGTPPGHCRRRGASRAAGWFGSPSTRLS